MDGLYPTSYCSKQPIRCTGDGGTMSYTGGTWASTAYIRNRGQTSFATMVYDEGWPDYLVNNPPAINVYVRVAPSQYDKNKMVFWLNGWERPRLVLTRGKKYQFNIVTAGHPFILTSDPNGGNGSQGQVGSVSQTDYFVFTISVSKETPTNFYYQCSNHPGMGGKVFVKD